LRIQRSRIVDNYRLSNISGTTKEVDFVRNADRAAGDHVKRNGQADQPTAEDDQLLDHHIEELRDMLKEAADELETPDTRDERPG
jgi:hypothetical protein